MENNLRNVREQIKENSEELQDFIRDLGKWEQEIKKKDEELRNRPKESKKYSTESDVSDTSVIATMDDNTVLDIKEKETQKEKNDDVEEDDEEEEENEEEEEAILRHLKQKALVEKDKGNRFFSEGKFDDAIACYTSGIQADPTNAVLPANRAMAFIKKGQLAAAEQDCTLSISLDCSYAKAFYRRGTCRLALKKLQLARQDFLKVMEMEPGNKFARIELDKLEQTFRNQDVPQLVESLNSPKSDRVTTKMIESGTSKPGSESSRVPTYVSATSEKPRETERKKGDSVGTTVAKVSVFSSLPDQVKPIYKAAHLKSKKPLERLEIEVHSSDEETEQLTIPPAAQRPTWLPTSRADSTTRSTHQQAQTPSTPSVTPSTPRSLPPPPNTAFQFEMNWRKLRHWPDLRTQYLKNVTPESLKNMYRQSMETEMFIDIIHCVKDISEGDKESAFHYLKCLTQVGRFSTTVMFLSATETQIIKSVLDVISPLVPCEEMKQLQSLYGL